MKINEKIKFGAKCATVVVLAGTVAGCFGPTYGTGKTAGAHLADDIGNSLSLGRKNRTTIEYAPRPSIVKPADTSSLPAPQDKISETSGEWPESPAEKRARILADIEAGKRPDNFVTNPDEAQALDASEGPGRQTVAGRRIYLTDPPSEYRQPAETADYGELGPTEAAKERARKKGAGKVKTGWRRFIPWG